MAEKRNRETLPYENRPGKAEANVQTRQGRKAEGVDGLQALIERAGDKKRGPAPVEKWDPDHVGEIDIVIRADGAWHYMGSPISRRRLVELFATVLRKDEDGETYLVTPVERLKIRVEDAHFIAVEMDASGEGAEQVLTFRTNVGDVVEADEDHPLRFETDGEAGGLKPYLLVRGQLEALLSRPVLHELAGLGEEVEINGTRMFAVRSRGAVFPIMPADELNRLSGPV